MTKSKEDWKKILSETEYNVLRNEGTERAYTSGLNEEKEREITTVLAAIINFLVQKWNLIAEQDGLLFWKLSGSIWNKHWF